MESVLGEDGLTFSNIDSAFKPIYLVTQGARPAMGLCGRCRAALELAISRREPTSSVRLLSGHGIERILAGLTSPVRAKRASKAKVL